MLVNNSNNNRYVILFFTKVNDQFIQIHQFINIMRHKKTVEVEKTYKYMIS